MSDASGRRRRLLHPLAWWVWAVSLALCVASTTNPLLLLMVIAVLVFTVLARRPLAAWSRSLRLYLGLGAFVIVSRVVLHVLVGMKTNDHVVLPLPPVALPHWAQGITLLGPVGVAGIVGAGLEGLRLATMLLCFGAANALANPRRMLAATPAAVRGVSTAVAIALSVAPQLVESVHRVRRARVLRGATRRRSRARQLALPVLHDTLDRSIALAASMESRGYGARRPVSRRLRWATGVLGLGGALLVCVGVYGTMQGAGAGGVVADVPWWTRRPILVLGLVMVVAAVALSGRATQRTRYRPDRWGALEWAVVVCSLATVVGVRTIFESYPDALMTPIQPLALPAMPVWLPLALLPALAPAFFTPQPVRVPRATPSTRGAVARGSDTRGSGRRVVGQRDAGQQDVGRQGSGAADPGVQGRAASSRPGANPRELRGALG